MTEKEREKLKESEIGYFLNAMVDPSVSQEEINNSNPHSSLGAGLKDIAIDYRNLTGGGQSLSNLLSELDKKADKDDIVDPTWGQITGSLPNQIDLKNALSGKASISDLAAIDTRTRNLESSKADKTYVDTIATDKADKTYVDTIASDKADKTYVDTIAADKADKTYVDTIASDKANAADVAKKADKTYVDTIASDKADKTYVDTIAADKADKTYVDSAVASKASVTLWDSIEIPASGWSSSAPYTQTVAATGMTAASSPNIDVKFNNNATMAIEKTYYNCVDQITTGTDTLTLVCPEEKPAGTFYIKVKEVG